MPTDPEASQTRDHSLTALVTQELEAAGETVLEEDIFGTGDAETIGRRYVSFVERHWGVPPAQALFYRASVGAVLALRLPDGREIVLKVYRRACTRSFLDGVHQVQSHLAAHGFPCPVPILPPSPFPGTRTALATAERLLLDPGLRPLGTVPEREAVATALAQEVHLTAGLHAPGLVQHPMMQPASGLYPEPHSPLFDFPASAQGAQWIDEWAAKARTLRDALVAPVVIAHTDWSARNLRVEGRQVVAVYDWDSLALVPEARAVGQAAMTWSRTAEPDGSGFPDADGVTAFMRDYERARGTPFSPDERRTALASALFVLAYTARCEHALAHRGTADAPHQGRDQLRRAGPGLLAMAASL